MPRFSDGSNRKALRGAAICILAMALSAGADDGLILHYTFDGASGNVARDVSGHGHDGVVHGGAEKVTGRFGTALKLDGIDDYIQCAGAAALETSDAFTVETWVYAEKSAGGIFSRHTGAGWKDQRLILAMHQRDEKDHLLCAISDGEQYLVARPGPPTLNRWVHLAVTFDGKTIRNYRDGDLEHRNNAARTFKPMLTGVPLYIGRSQGIGPAPFFKGMVGEVRYYRRALSAAAIRNRLVDNPYGVAAAAPARAWRHPDVQTVGHREDGSVVLPTEQTLRPAGKTITFHGRPVDMVLSPDERWLVATTSYQVVLMDVNGAVRDALRLPKGRANSLHGILFSPDSRSVYVAGHRGQIERLNISDNGKLELGELRKPWKSAICGMTFSRDGRYMYAAASPSNRLLVLDRDLATERTAIPVGVAPFSVIHGPGNKLYVSNWGGRHPGEDDDAALTAGTRVKIDPETGLPGAGTVSVLEGDGRSLKLVRTIDVGRFPCQLALSPDGDRLYVPNANDDTVSIVDTTTDTVINTINVKPDDQLPYGSQPIAVAVSPDGSTLYVANATNNAIAVVRHDRLAGLIPVGWFPGAIQLSKDGGKLYVANVRGLGAENEPKRNGRHVGDFLGLVNIIDAPDAAQLARYTQQVAQNNRQFTPLVRHRPRQATDKLVPVPTKPGESSVFEHVIYVIKENHSYDQDLGDMTEGNGEPRLCSAPERITPNEHKLAREFVLLDNYHVPSVQSPSGHIWISQGICSSYWEKAITSWPRYYSYSGKDALAFSSSGFLWTNATKHGLTFRNYGEYVDWNVAWADENRKDKITFTDVWNDFQAGGNAIRITNEPTVASLKPYTHPHYPGYGYLVTDVQRAHIFIEDLKRFEREGNMPRLIWLWLPNNHTSGSRPGFPTATAQIADNDMALGLVVEAVSRSKFWPKTAIFVTEDDPWNGTDHVAGSRTMCFVASPYTKRKAVISNLYTLTGLLKTMELILGLPMMNQLDLIATPMTDCFTNEPDFTPYTHIPSNIALDKLNLPVSQLQGRDRYWAQRSMEIPLTEEPDAFPAQLEMFKRLAWYTTMGADVPYTYVNEDGKVVQETRGAP